MVSGLPAASEPPKANWMSFHVHDASASARRTATAPCSMPVDSWRPKGWMPTPTMATSLLLPALMSALLPSTGANAKVTTSVPSSSVVNGTMTSSTGMPMASRSGSFSVEAGLDDHAATVSVVAVEIELDVAHPVGHEGLRRLLARVGRRLRQEALDRPAPQPAAAGQQDVLDDGRRRPRARGLPGEGDDAALGEPAADELRLVGRPGEEAVDDGPSRRGGHRTLSTSSVPPTSRSKATTAPA